MRLARSTDYVLNQISSPLTIQDEQTPGPGKEVLTLRNGTLRGSLLQKRHILGTSVCTGISKTFAH